MMNSMDLDNSFAELHAREILEANVASIERRLSLLYEDYPEMLYDTSCVAAMNFLYTLRHELEGERELMIRKFKRELGFDAPEPKPHDPNEIPF